MRPDVARYTNTLARKNTDGKLKKKQKNLKKNQTETISNSKPEEKGNSREEKINDVESQVRMGWVLNQGLGSNWVWVESLSERSAFKGRLWHSRKNHKHSRNIILQGYIRKIPFHTFLSPYFSETRLRSSNFDKPKRLSIDILDLWFYALSRDPRTSKQTDALD